MTQNPCHRPKRSTKINFLGPEPSSGVWGPSTKESRPKSLFSPSKVRSIPSFQRRLSLFRGVPKIYRRDVPDPYSGMARARVGGPKWTKMDLFSPKWTRMHHFGPFWSRECQNPVWNKVIQNPVWNKVILTKMVVCPFWPSTLSDSTAATPYLQCSKRSCQ